MIALLLLFFLSPDSHACNNLQIEQLDNVSFNSSLTPTETFRVKRSGNNACDFFLTIDNGGAGSYSSRRISHEALLGFIPVQLCADAACSSPLKHFPEATSPSDVLTGSFAGGNSSPDQVYLVFYPRLGTADYQRFGRYEAYFNMRVYEGSVNGSYSLEDTASFRLRYDMSKRIDLSVVNTGSPFDPSSTSKTLSFGILSAGQSLGFDLVVKYNAGYRVRMSSQNNGRLKHASLAATIPYTLTMNGNPVSLNDSSNNPVTVSQGTGLNPAGGLRFPGQVQIGAVGGAQSGSYQDSITITVATTE